MKTDLARLLAFDLHLHFKELDVEALYAYRGMDNESLAQIILRTA